MLNKSRDDVMREITSNLESNMNNVCLVNGSWTLNSNSYYNQKWNLELCQNIEEPPVADGWPPEVAEYIRRVALMTATVIVDAIYTEQELEVKVENILLEDDEQSTDSII